MKKVLFILLVVSVLMLGACSKKVVIDEKGNIIEAKGVKVIEGNAEKTETKNVVKEVKEDLTSLLSSGTSSKCTFTDSEGSQNTMWIKGSEYKIKSISSDGTAWSLKSGNLLYIWSEEITTGFKFDLTKSGQQIPVPTAEQLAKSTPNAQCEKVTLSDADFALPTGIEFMSGEEMAALSG